MNVIVDRRGSVIWRRGAVTLGGVIVDQGVTNRILGAGRYYDEESLLDYNWYRYLDIGLNRYIRMDPVGLADGVNAYIYAGNNPVRYIDNTGLSRELPGPLRIRNHVSSALCIGVNLIDSLQGSEVDGIMEEHGRRREDIYEQCQRRSDLCRRYDDPATDCIRRNADRCYEEAMEEERRVMDRLEQVTEDHVWIPQDFIDLCVLIG